MAEISRDAPGQRVPVRPGRLTPAVAKYCEDMFPGASRAAGHRISADIPMGDWVTAHVVIHLMPVKDDPLSTDVSFRMKVRGSKIEPKDRVAIEQMIDTVQDGLDSVIYEVMSRPHPDGPSLD